MNTGMPEDAFIALREDLNGARAALRSALAAADSIRQLERLFVQTPVVFEGWERLSIWLDLDRQVRALGSGQSAATATAALILTMRLRLALRDYDGFLACLDQAPAELGGVWMTKFHHTARLLRSEKFPDFGAEKIFGIGLSKTGTTSLARALGMLGFHAAHYFNDFTRELLTIEDTFLFDAMTDTPVCVMFEALYYMFPNSKFIYTVRPLESWAASVTKHFQRHHRSTGFDPHHRHLLTTRGAGVNGVQRALVHGALFYHHPDAIAARQSFEARVRNFFDGHDRSRLLELDIFSGDGWEKLCRFIGRPIPGEPFPWENKAPDSPGHRHG